MKTLLPKRPLGRLLLASSLLIAACQNAEQSAEPELAGERQALNNLGRAADAESLAYEVQMDAGRRSKVPVSRAWNGKFQVPTQGAARDVHVRATCVDANSLSDACDPAILVVVRDENKNIVDVQYHNNTMKTKTVLGIPMPYFEYDAALTINQPANSTRFYEVVAYSHNRGTSRVDIGHVDTAVGATPTSFNTTFADPLTNLTVSGSQQEIGGALVQVGPASAGEGFGVRTESDGATEGTRMWMFEPTYNKFAFVDNGAGTDKDPNFTYPSDWVCEDSCPKPYTQYAIVGLDPATEQLEVFVDLTKSIQPESVDQSFGFPNSAPCNGNNARPNCSATKSVTLGAGIYAFSAFVTAAPVGSRETVTPNLASDTGQPMCKSITARGMGNDLAFKVELLRDGAVVGSRLVSRGTLGAAEGYANRVTMSYTASDDGTEHAYTMRFSQVGHDVTILDRWRYRKNPEQVEMKLATMNKEYCDSGCQSENEMKNIAAYLGSGPSYSSDTTNSRAISNRGNRGRFHWEADVVSLNEVLEGGRIDQVKKGLDENSLLNWSMSNGYSMTTDGSAGNKYGPVYLNHRVTLGGGDGKFTVAELEAGGCRKDNRCWLSDDDTGYTQSYHTVPAKAALRRINGTTNGSAFGEKPVTVFNLYLPPGKGSSHGGLVAADWDVGNRAEGVERMITKIKGLVKSAPGAFHSAGTAGDSMNLGNRMVILGDSNMYNTQCSEVNTLLRALRKEFGYAIDASMAFVDPNGRTADMHYSGASMSEHPFEAGTMGTCQPPKAGEEQWSRFTPGEWDPPFNLSFKGTATGCPYHYESTSYWNAQSEAERFSTDSDQWHAWWAGTSSGQGGSRHDIVILAGLGWADDDPLMDYMVSWNKEQVTTSYMGGSDGAAMELRTWCTDSGSASSDASNYDPIYQPVCDNEATGPGHLPFRTDHKPVGVRLRSQMLR